MTKKNSIAILFSCVTISACGMKPSGHPSFLKPSDTARFFDIRSVRCVKPTECKPVYVQRELPNESGQDQVSSPLLENIRSKVAFTICYQVVPCIAGSVQGSYFANALSCINSERARIEREQEKLRAGVRQKNMLRDKDLPEAEHDEIQALEVENTKLEVCRTLLFQQNGR